MMQPSPDPRAPLTGRVALVEDAPAIQRALAEMIGRIPDLTLLGVGATVAEGLALLRERPDVFLIDLGLADGSGIDLLTAARRTLPSCKLLVISAFGDVHNVVRAIEAGADGYLLKSADLDQADAALRVVLEGGAPISPAVAGHVLKRVRKPVPQGGAAELTPREIEVLELLAKGLTYKEVADVIGVSHHTVGDHVKTIYRKLAVTSRGEAVFEALQAGLLPPTTGVTS